VSKAVSAEIILELSEWVLSRVNAAIHQAQPVSLEHVAFKRFNLSCVVFGPGVGHSVNGGVAIDASKLPVHEHEIRTAVRLVHQLARVEVAVGHSPEVVGAVQLNLNTIPGVSFVYSIDAIESILVNFVVLELS
jgi:hypothetical protein